MDRENLCHGERSIFSKENTPQWLKASTEVPSLFRKISWNSPAYCGPGTNRCPGDHYQRTLAGRTVFQMPSQLSRPEQECPGSFIELKTWPWWQSWMKEVKGIRHRGRGVYLRCPVFTTVQFSLRNEGSSEYICLCEGREILSPNFQTFQDPRHQFHGIGRLVSETLYLFATLALLHIQAEQILGTFLPSLKV